MSDSFFNGPEVRTVVNLTQDVDGRKAPWTGGKEIAFVDSNGDPISIAALLGGGGGGASTIGGVAGLQAALNAKAPLASPTFTGTPQAPTPAGGDNGNRVATTAFVQTAISGLEGGGGGGEFLPVGTGPGTVAAGDDSRIVNAVPNTRQVTTSGLVAGGGPLTNDLVLNVAEATQAEAEAGTVANKAMSPRRVKQAIAALAPVGGGGSGFTETTAFRVYAGANNRSLAARLQDAIVVNDLSDGSGNAANDDAALSAAIAQAGTTGNRPILLTRAFRVLSEKNIPSNIRIVGTGGPNSSLVAVAAMRSILNFDQANGSAHGNENEVENVALRNDLENFTYSGSGIRVSKGFNNLPVFLHRVTGHSLSKLVDWIDGDRPHFREINTINCVETLYFRNNGMNGIIFGLSTLGGRGIFIGRDPSAPNGPQQMEGTKFIGINILQGIQTPNNAAPSAGISIRAGMYLSFVGVMVDQLYYRAGLVLESTAAGESIYGVDFLSFWFGANGNAVATECVRVTGLTRQISFRDGHIIGSVANGVNMVGGTVVNGQTFRITAVFDNVSFRENGKNGVGSDIYLKQANVSIRDCKFESTTSGAAVVDDVAVAIAGDNNEFSGGGIVHLNGGGFSNWLRSRGPEAPVGAVPISVSGSPGSGWFWKDGTNVRMT